MPVATVAGTPPSPFTASAGVKPWPTPRMGEALLPDRGEVEGVMEGEARREREAVGEGVIVVVGVGEGGKGKSMGKAREQCGNKTWTDE